MKAVILAGGNGTRLYPLTKSISKHLLPVNDKPMIYYPLSLLMLAGIRQFAIVTTEEHDYAYQQLLGDGTHLGVHIRYFVQRKAAGLADALLLAEPFIGEEAVVVMLGDNIFYSEQVLDLLNEAINDREGATIFAMEVDDPRRFAVVECTDTGEIVSLDEKPAAPKSNVAVTGLYRLDQKAIAFARNVQPSTRGEVEMTDLLKMYLAQGELRLVKLHSNTIWIDAGTLDSLKYAEQAVQQVEHRIGRKVGCIEEIAYRKRYISYDQLVKLGTRYKNSEYGTYLTSVKERKDE